MKMSLIFLCTMQEIGSLGTMSSSHAPFMTEPDMGEGGNLESGQEDGTVVRRENGLMSANSSRRGE
jgi:hypothetical protein